MESLCAGNGGWRLGVRIAGKVGVTGPPVVCAAMEAVGSRTGLRSDDGRDSLAELGIEVLRGDLGLGHCIRRRVDNNDSENRVLVVGAVQLEGRSTERLAVNLDLF